METTSNKIEKALLILEHQDFYWKMADYATKACHEAYCTMKAFVKLVNTIEDKTIVNALRDLWIATYNYAQAAMLGRNESAAKAEFKSKEAELMAIINPQLSAAA